MTQRFTSFLAGLLLVALSLPATAWAEEESVIELTFAGRGESSSRSITLANSTTSTTSVEIGVETELVGTVLGVKAGVGFNYNHTNENTHTIGQQLTVEGTVPGLPSLNDSAHPGFNWNIVWYYVNDEGNVYPVVNYAVVKQ